MGLRRVGMRVGLSPLMMAKALGLCGLAAVLGALARRAWYLEADDALRLAAQAKLPSLLADIEARKRATATR